MKKTGAWLARYALEQIGVTHTFGIPGVHNTELYDELNKSEQVTPVLVTHEGGAAFMADAISRTSDHIGTLLIVPAAGVTHAASGIGEAFLDGIPMLVIAGGIRSDSDYRYQLHEMDQHALLAPITKGTWKVATHAEVIPTLYEAYRVATSGEPGPVFVEIPVNIQLDQGTVDSLPAYQPAEEASPRIDDAELERAAQLLLQARRPGLFLGWGALGASEHSIAIAEHLNAPVCTTLQGLSAFPANHPLHTGMSFGPHSVPAAEKAFAECDCLLAVGTRFGEIATGSYGMPVPSQLIHIDINPAVLNNNFPATVALEGDANELLGRLRQKLEALQPRPAEPSLRDAIAADKRAYLEEWFAHNSGERVNPARFFSTLRQQLRDDAWVVADDGNHTFLTAELMPIHEVGHFISPTDFNCMGYAVPATTATKLANPDQQVVGIIGDGAFMMTCMELVTANSLGTGALYVVFNDGELSQIAQAQQIPYNRKTCTLLKGLNLAGVALATGTEYLALNSNEDIDSVLQQALALCDQGRPVVLDVRIDYSKPTRFTGGAVSTNLKRMPLNTKVRMISRALWRKLTG
ncbi:thiamine pyrophosphate-binding protein [Aestuariirhabdus litorea]|uniref:Thiamine pyrophosphate-binding protein n=1 Tax=Aestuariirhabdus litorea TaxID=2528527 RepID=A0A3P3VIH7_9GAMM|nr:thiamine pyrophosphate-binding protein [Aestuariirhabdus litorea]RRJ82472.1 thiamine pyrophosphate-binding protein [Aestuariirhabdus litorea]RWW92633.1 thiamine pyrophosphate-binding protein [Endozoicomonadaceae bacterium GTF-13]